VAFEKILVTGGSGRLGRHVVDALSGDYHVTVLDIKPPQQDVAYDHVDILDLDAVKGAVAGQDAVIHLAGYDDGDAPTDQAYFQTNTQGAWNIFHASEEVGIKHVVFASSTATFGIGRSRAPDYLPLDDNHPQRPMRTYDVSKQVIETTARHFAGRGNMTMVGLRPTLIVRPEKEAEIAAQLELANADEDGPEDFIGSNGSKAYGALSPTRTYVFSRDCADAFRAALDYHATPFDTFIIAADDNIGRVDTLTYLKAFYGDLPDLIDKDYFKDQPQRSVLDNRKAKSLLNWAPAGTRDDAG
jgi:UDP-glucose 4-epimerase